MGLQRIHARVARLAKMGYRGFTTLVEEGENDVTEEVLCRVFKIPSLKCFVFVLHVKESVDDNIHRY